jgi:hypothetical protein
MYHVLTSLEEEVSSCASRETDAVCVAFLLFFGAPIIFSRASCAGIYTTASSCEFFSATAEVGGGSTTTAVSFGLSSSLRKIV